MDQKCKKIIISTFLILLAGFWAKLPVRAESNNLVCDNRYLNLVNPVRSRQLWTDKSLKPINDQYRLITENGFEATWLLQYDTLKDDELVSIIKNFNKNQELGVFLEVSETLANEANVIYPINIPWYKPNAVFLSGYKRSDRIRMIDKLLGDFQKRFGFIPKSVGAWWIDSYTLEYLKRKYGIKTVMIVADQEATDGYGVWGQWWGIPYYPSKFNVLVPGNGINKLDVAIIQWAQRDPIMAYGGKGENSLYSLQANDYVKMGKNTDYFKQLVNTYLNCNLKVGQITVGLETGMESVDYFQEYKNQLAFLKDKKTIKSLTMSDFYDSFKTIYKENPDEVKLNYKDDQWILTKNSRINLKLNDLTIYNPDLVFSDYFLADKNEFLNRKLEITNNQKNINSKPYWLIITTVSLTFILIFNKKYLKIWTVSTLFSLIGFGLIFKSFYGNGYKVYYGLPVNNLELIQVLIISGSLIFFFIFKKLLKYFKYNNYLWIGLILSFGIDTVFRYLRISILLGTYYCGILINNLQFVGLGVRKTGEIEFLNQKLPGYVADSLLKFNFEKMWNNYYLTLIVYPLGHIIIGIIIFIILRRSPKYLKYLLIFILIIFLGINIWDLLKSDPRIIVPIFKSANN
ncbi:MAG: hypothetical protein Q8P53_03165 [Candidatus Shapirobacteria bacterium]|nr:hypothetical protein [Candidatus Shapirobacteria bacterium]